MYREFSEERYSDEIFEGVRDFKSLFSLLAGHFGKAFPEKNFKRKREPEKPGRALTQLEADCAEWSRACTVKANSVTEENRGTLRKL